MRFHEFMIFRGDIGGAVRCLRRSEDAELLESAQQFPFIVKVEGGVIGGRKGKNHALAVFEKAFYLIEIARKRFRILWAGIQAFAAEDAVRLDDLGLLADQPDGFHRADLDALIAIFAVCLLQSNDAHVAAPFSQADYASLSKTSFLKKAGTSAGVMENF